MKDFTEQQLRDSIAQKEAWFKRVGPEMAKGFLLLIEAMALPPLVFSVVANKVEFSAEEKERISGAFDTIAQALKSHAERVTGYREGMGEAAESTKAVEFAASAFLRRLQEGGVFVIPEEFS